MQGVPSCCCPCASGRRSFESCEEELVTGFGDVLYPTLPTCRKTSLHSEAIESEGGGLTRDQEESWSPAPPVVVSLASCATAAEGTPHGASRRGVC